MMTGGKALIARRQQQKETTMMKGKGERKALFR
jgi:hypothetical protein